MNTAMPFQWKHTMSWLLLAAFIAVCQPGCDPHDTVDSVDGNPGDTDSADTAPEDNNDCQIHVQSCTGESVRGFYDDFEDATASQANWGTTNFSFDTGYLGGQALRIDVAEAATTRMVTYALPVEGLRGAKVTVTGMVRRQDISDKPQAWNGVKLMLAVTTPTGTLYPNASTGTGTFDWQYQGLLCNVPEDAESATLYLGLEQVTGSAWFDEIEVRIDACRPTVSFNPDCPIYTGHEVPTLRGAMVSNKRATVEDIRVLGQEWNANLMRWQLFGTTETNLGAPDFDSLLQAETDALDELLPACREYGVRVVVDLHSRTMGMFDSVANQDKFVAVWEGLAAKYKDNEVIWAYDIKNEPSDIFPRPAGVLDSREIAERAARAIREIDSETTIIKRAVGDVPVFRSAGRRAPTGCGMDTAGFVVSALGRIGRIKALPIVILQKFKILQPLAKICTLAERDPVFKNTIWMVI